MKEESFNRMEVDYLIDHKLIQLIECNGYVNKHGQRIRGTAALLHILYCPIRCINPKYIEIGKAYVENHLFA